MAVCAYCSTTIIFGGTKEGDLRFCNEKCAEKGYALIVAEQIPEDMLQAEVEQIHQSPQRSPVFESCNARLKVDS